MSREDNGFRGRKLASNEKLHLESVIGVIRRLDKEASGVGEPPRSWVRALYANILMDVDEVLFAHGER